MSYVSHTSGSLGDGMSETRTRRVGAHPPSSPLADDRSWSFAEVAYFLNVSESTVRNLERDGVLPALPRIGRRVNFDPKVVRAFRHGWRPPGVRPPLPLADVRSLPGRE
jgi:hypothetical protein